MFVDDTWDLFKTELGKRDMEVLEKVMHAIVHRYESNYSDSEHTWSQSTSFTTSQRAFA